MGSLILAFIGSISSIIGFLVSAGVCYSIIHNEFKKTISIDNNVIKLPSETKDIGKNKNYYYFAPEIKAGIPHRVQFEISNIKEVVLEKIKWKPSPPALLRNWDMEFVFKFAFAQMNK